MALYAKNIQENNGVLTIGLHNVFVNDTSLNGDFNSMQYTLNLNNMVSYNQIEGMHIYKFPITTITLWSKEYPDEIGEATFARIQENNPSSQLDLSVILDNGTNEKYTRLKEILDNVYARNIAHARSIGEKAGHNNSGNVNNYAPQKKKKFFRKTRKARKN